jgi:hypothetical protein
MSVGQSEDELSHSPRLFDRWCGNVGARCDGPTVRRVKLCTDIDIHSDRRNWQRCRDQPKARAYAPRTENHTDHGRRFVHRIERLAPNAERNRYSCAATSRTGSVTSTLSTVVGSDTHDLARTIISCGRVRCGYRCDNRPYSVRPILRAVERDRTFVASTQASTRSRLNDPNAYSTTAPAASVIRPRPQACLHSNQLRPGTATSPSNPTTPTGASASRSTHKCAPFAFETAHQGFLGIRDVGAQRRVPPTHYVRVAETPRVNPLSHDWDPRVPTTVGQYSAPTDFTTDRGCAITRLIAGIEAENIELAGQGRELIRGTLSYQPRPLREADPDRHLDCEAAQHGTGLLRAEFDDFDPS